MFTLWQIYGGKQLKKSYFKNLKARWRNVLQVVTKKTLHMQILSNIKANKKIDHVQAEILNFTSSCCRLTSTCFRRRQRTTQIRSPLFFMPVHTYRHITVSKFKTCAGNYKLWYRASGLSSGFHVLTALSE